MKDTIRDRPVFAFFGLTMASSWGSGGRSPWEARRVPSPN